MIVQYFLFVAVLTFLSLISEIEERFKVVFPTEVFNSEAAKLMIEKEGTSILRGVVSEKDFYPFNEVQLFPCTAYFDEWYALKKKYKRKNKVILMSKEAYSFRLVATISETGAFQFDGLKPGKYYLRTMAIANKPIKGKYVYGDEQQAFVEITGNKQTVYVTF